MYFPLHRSSLIYSVFLLLSQCLLTHSSLRSLKTLPEFGLSYYSCVTDRIEEVAITAAQDVEAGVKELEVAAQYQVSFQLFTTQSLNLTTQKKKTLENTVGKGEKKCW